ncbi:MAG: DUF885 domain-containing protein [Candidatus Marinimicrobia bacterium]|nr:DUF885 domain-containing protein [Candidatus Neomarinimicrobiota bacterium]
MRKTYSLPIVIVLLVFNSCSIKQETESEKLHNLFNDVWGWGLKEFPTRATYLGDYRYNDRLTNMSLASIQRRYKKNKSILSKLENLNREKLDAGDKLNYDLFQKNIKRNIAAHPFKDYLMPVDQMGGLQINFPNLVDITPFRNRGDFDNYLARLSLFPEYVDQIIALMREGLKENITPPKIVLQKVPDQISVQYQFDVKNSPFYEPFEKNIVSLQDSIRAHYQELAVLNIKDHVFTSYRKLFDFFVEEYLPRTRENISAMSLPNGDKFYAFKVKYYTTTNKTPSEIHSIGLREVARIRSEMEKVIKDSGFTGSFKEFIAYLRTNPDFYYESAEELLDGYRAICKKADPELTKLFGTLPRLSYGVKPIPDFQAPASPTAYYYSGSLKAGRPGYFWANTYKLDTRPKYEMEALSLHEAVPGHHLQISISQELEDVPEFRKHGGFTAFSEGWGLYSEKLGEEMGFYKDPYSKFGQLTYEMWRACRLVVDTGMHAFGWSRERAIKFVADNTAKAENDIFVEIDRYIAWPGQALAYKIGELRIIELRSLAEEKLGENFDIREFHDTVLGSGAVPLDILEEHVKEYIAINLDD